MNLVWPRRKFLTTSDTGLKPAKTAFYGLLVLTSRKQ